MNNLGVLLASAVYRGFTIKFEPYNIPNGYVRIVVTYKGMNYAQLVHEDDFYKDLYSTLSIMIGQLEYNRKCTHEN